MVEPEKTIDDHWFVLCPACGGRTHIENVPNEVDILPPYKRHLYNRSEDTWTAICSVCDGRGTIEA